MPLPRRRTSEPPFAHVSIERIHKKSPSTTCRQPDLKQSRTGYPTSVALCRLCCSINFSLSSIPGRRIYFINLTCTPATRRGYISQIYPDVFPDEVYTLCCQSAAARSMPHVYSVAASRLARGLQFFHFLPSSSLFSGPTHFSDRARKVKYQASPFINEFCF